MHARLIGKTGQLAGKEFDIADEAVIGSDPGCTIQIKQGIISARHARIYLDRAMDAYFLEDLGSFNGTKVDGKDVSGKIKLDKTHIIILSNLIFFMYKLVKEPLAAAPEPQAPVEEEAPPPPPTAREPERPVPPPPPPADAAATVLIEFPAFLEPKEKFQLEVTVADGTSKTYPLKEGENLIGRLSTSDLCFDDPSISRKHATVTVKEGTVRLNDLGSKNGTFLDDQKVTGEIEIAPDAKIRFGLISAVLQRQQAPEGAGREKAS
jgi:pSer/pThr/pTyr-binding forkhead associated (FHA) protein